MMRISFINSWKNKITTDWFNISVTSFQGSIWIVIALFGFGVFISLN